MLTATLSGSFLTKTLTVMSNLPPVKPDPGGDGGVVEEDRGSAAQVHWLSLLVDDIVVDPVKHGEDTEASDDNSPHRSRNFTHSTVANLADEDCQRKGESDLQCTPRH